MAEGGEDPAYDEKGDHRTQTVGAHRNVIEDVLCCGEPQCDCRGVDNPVGDSVDFTALEEE